MIFNMTGGGNPLNFKVVGGTTAPSNPKENTIWVNTDKEITGWHFTSKQPDDMKEGEVWFSTNTSSTVEFNALKKNGIQVYPIFAKQYVSGALAGKEAKSYQNGEWVDLARYLYNQGNEYTAITGGWSAKALAMNSYFTAKAPTITKNSNSMTVTLASSAGAFSGLIHISKDIDLTYIKEITASFPSVTANGSYGSDHSSKLQLLVINRNSTYADSYVAIDVLEIKNETKNDVILSVKTEAISGLYDIAIFVSNFAINATITAEVQSVKIL